MAESLSSALGRARRRTAGPGSEWEQARITDLTPHDTSDHLALTATTEDGTVLRWDSAVPPSMDKDALVSRLTAAADAPEDASLIGETVWVRKHVSPEFIPADSARWDTTGEWVLESLASRQQRQRLVYRWGRTLLIGVVFLEETLGRWRLVVEIGVIAALAVLIEPARVIVVPLVLLMCQEVGLNAV